MQPRVIRLKDAPQYLGMNKNLFNSLVRPRLTEYRIGIQGIGFDRDALDEWLDNYSLCEENIIKKAFLNKNQMANQHENDLKAEQEFNKAYQSITTKT